MPPRTPTPEMIVAGVAAWPSSLRTPEKLMTLVWQAMWDAAQSKPVWRPMWTSVEAFGRKDPPDRFERSDGATVRYVETKTGKRPWRGSHWHNGCWVLNASTANWVSAEGGMSAINYHWPNAMNPTEDKDA